MAGGCWPHADGPGVLTPGDESQKETVAGSSSRGAVAPCRRVQNWCTLYLLVSGPFGQCDGSVHTTEYVSPGGGPSSPGTLAVQAASVPGGHQAEAVLSTSQCRFHVSLGPLIPGQTYLVANKGNTFILGLGTHSAL